MFCSNSIFSQQLDLVKLAPKCKESVVSIEVYNDERKVIASGTGFFIDSIGTIASCYHIFEGASSAKIYTSNGNYFKIKKVLSWSKKNDLILLIIDNTNNIKLPFLPINNLEVQDGESVFTIGNPYGLEYSISSGVVSAVRNHSEYGKIIQFTAPISEGNSGSPLINSKGYFVGIISFGFIGGQNLNFAISANELSNLETINELRYPIDIKSKISSIKSNIIRAKWGESIYTIKGKEKNSEYDEFTTNMNNYVLYETMNNFTKCLVYNNVNIGELTASVEYVFERDYLSGINISGDALVKIKDDNNFLGYTIKINKLTDHINDYIKILNFFNVLYGEPQNIGKKDCISCFTGELSQILEYNDVVYQNLMNNKKSIYLQWESPSDNVRVKLSMFFYGEEIISGKKEQQGNWQIQLSPLR